MVGRLVKEEEVGLLQQQLAECDTAALAAGQRLDRRVVGRTAQRLHRLVDLGIEVPQALGLDLVLELGHLVRGLVGIVDGELVVAVEDRLLRRDALHHVLAHGLVGIELRFLRKIAARGAFGDPGLAVKLGVDAGHDAQQRRLAGAVDAEHADFCVGIERQMDVLQNLAVARIGLGETLHVIDELTGHERRTSGGWGRQAPDVGKSTLM